MKFLTDQFSYHDAVTLDRLIRKSARPGMTVFELGSYTGRSSLTMLQHIARMEGMLYCVDWFRGNPGAPAETIKSPQPQKKARSVECPALTGAGAEINRSYEYHNILDIFQENIRENGFEDYVTVLIGKSESVASAVADNIADLIFIDADHRYSYVRKDILNWYPKLKEGGIICGHDFEKRLRDCDPQDVLEKCEEEFVDGCHYGVIRAVCEFFPEVRWEGRIWYAEKGSSCNADLESALADAKRVRTRLEDQSNALDVSYEGLDYQHIFSLFVGDAASSTPQVIEVDHRGYNIVLYAGEFYGIAQGLGPLDLSQVGQHTLKEYRQACKCMVADSLEEIKRLIDRLGCCGCVKLVEENYKGYNLALYLDKFYGIPQTLGPVDLNQVEEDTRSRVESVGNRVIGTSLAVGKSLEHVKQLVDEMVEGRH